MDVSPKRPTCSRKGAQRHRSMGKRKSNRSHSERPPPAFGVSVAKTARNRKPEMLAGTWEGGALARWREENGAAAAGPAGLLLNHY